MIMAAVRAQKPIVEDIRQRRGNLMDILRSELAFPIRPSSGLLKFARDIAVAWDATGRDERIRLGLSSGFVDPESLDSQIFGMSGSLLKFRMGTLLVKATRTRLQMIRLSLMHDFREGKIGFERIQEHLQKTSKVTLQKLEKTDKGALILGEPDFKMIVRDVEASLRDVRRRFSAYLIDIAKRLAVGFSPVVY
jgi:hypothetical protein